MGNYMTTELTASALSIDALKDGKDKELIGTVSTTTGQERVSTTRADFANGVWSGNEAMVKLLNGKLGRSDLLFVVFGSNDLWDILAHTFSLDYEVVLYKFSDWDTFKEPDTKKQIIYTGWVENPIRKFIEEGRISPSSIIMKLGKDTDFEFYEKTQDQTINVFMNSEGDQGLKFKGCDKWHLVFHSPFEVVDTNIIFHEGKDDCVCGYPGPTFTFEAAK